MVAPISALANMEMALYGNVGLGINAAAPSLLNGYKGGIGTTGYSQTNPYMYNNYNYGNPYAMNPASYSASSQIAQQPQTQTQQTQTTATTRKSDLDTLVEYYKKNNAIEEEGFVGAAVGGAAFGIINNPRLIAHPYNSIVGLKDVKEMFKGVKVDGSNLNKLWKENHSVMREAYFQMHKASSRANSKLGLFRKRYDATEYQRLKGIMESALQSGDVQKVAEASVQLKEAYKGDGFILRNLKKLKESILGKDKPVDVTAAAQKAVAEGKNVSFMNALKHGGGIKGGLMFAGLELLLGMGKISTAFSKDNETGFKQLGQTTVRGIGSAVGWATGEALGVWGMAAMGAKIGTVFGPGVGTAIGGVIGLIGGSIGCWLAGKATKAIVGEDVADEVEAKKMAKGAQGQEQLLNLVVQKVQAGEKVPDNVIQAAQNVALQLQRA